MIVVVTNERAAVDRGQQVATLPHHIAHKRRALFMLAETLNGYDVCAIVAVVSCRVPCAVCQCAQIRVTATQRSAQPQRLR